MKLRAHPRYYETYRFSSRNYNDWSNSKEVI